MCIMFVKCKVYQVDQETNTQNELLVPNQIRFIKDPILSLINSQERALYLTNRDKLNVELGWESISKRIEFLGLSLFHKIHLNETRPLIGECMSKLDCEMKYLMKHKGV